MKLGWTIKVKVSMGLADLEYLPGLVMTKIFNPDQNSNLYNN